jgi:hypothetical protein
MPSWARGGTRDPCNAMHMHMHPRIRDQPNGEQEPRIRPAPCRCRAHLRSRSPCCAPPFRPNRLTVACTSRPRRGPEVSLNRQECPRFVGRLTPLLTSSIDSWLWRLRRLAAEADQSRGRVGFGDRPGAQPRAALRLRSGKRTQPTTRGASRIGCAEPEPRTLHARADTAARGGRPDSRAAICRRGAGPSVYASQGAH